MITKQTIFRSSIVCCKSILLLVFIGTLVFLFHQVSAKTVAKDTKETQNDIQMGNVILNKEKSFESQVNKSNTIYEIRYDFDLEHKSVEIPKNCILLIIGGSIKNGVIVGKETEILFVSGVLNCQLDGSFKNDNIQMEWFGIKTGVEFANNNDNVLQTYIIPSMKNIGNTLYLNPQTNMYFCKPLVFDGSYELDIRGKLLYLGALESIAVSIGTPDKREYAKKYSIHSVTAVNKDRFYNKGKVTESVGVCLWNLKQCDIVIDEVTNFGYCLRLCGSVGGCSSNKIQFMRIGGHCYYGIHCLSYDTGWVNENTFYCKSIMNNSGNPAKDVMCAIWLESRGKHTCNGNVFFDPCVEGCSCMLVCTNAKFNIIHDARAEKINRSISADDKSRDNIIYVKYWDKGDYYSIGSNRVVKQSEIIPPLNHVFSEQIGKVNSLHYGVCDAGNGFRVVGTVNGGFIFGKIVEISDANIDSDIEIVFEQPGRLAILFLNDDYSVKTKGNVEQNILNTNVPITRLYTGVRTKLDERRISLQLSKHSGKMLVGTYSESSYGNVISMSVYSNNLIVDELFNSETDIFTLNQDVGIKAFYYEDATTNFLTKIETIHLNGVLNLEKKTLDLNNKILKLEKRGGVINGTLNINGAVIYPNYNSLIDGSNIIVKGIPAAGTIYFQKGKPTWSNGKAWVDSSGAVVN